MNSTPRFDEAAAQWDNNPGRVALARAIGEAIRRVIAPEPSWRALDYGAGTGLVTLSLQPQVSSIVAVDASAGMLEMLSNKLAAAGIGNVTTRQWDLDQHAFPETDFDLVFSSMTLHHLPRVPLIFQRFAALLKTGGKIAVADLDTEDGSFHGPANEVPHHGFDRSQIRQWLTDAGFKNVKVEDAYLMAKPDASGQIRNYGIFLATGIKS